MKHNPGRKLFKWLALTEAWSFEGLEFVALGYMLNWVELKLQSTPALSPQPCHLSFPAPIDL